MSTIEVTILRISAYYITITTFENEPCVLFIYHFVVSTKQIISIIHSIEVVIMLEIFG